MRRSMADLVLGRIFVYVLNNSVEYIYNRPDFLKSAIQSNLEREGNWLMMDGTMRCLLIIIKVNHL